MNSKDQKSNVVDGTKPDPKSLGPSAPGEFQPSKDSSRPQIEKGDGTFDGERELYSILQVLRFHQKLLVGVLVAAIIMGLGVSVFFIKQMRLVRQQIDLQRVSTIDGLRDFTLRVEPEIHRFAAKLQSFSATNTDFRPVIEMYQPRLTRYFPNLTPGVTGQRSSPSSAKPQAP